MYGTPGVEAPAATVARAKVEVRWATAEALLGFEVDGFAEGTCEKAVQHLLLLHALHPDAVALDAEQHAALRGILAAAAGRSLGSLLSEGCSGSHVLATDMEVKEQQLEAAGKVCSQGFTETELKKDQGGEHLDAVAVAGNKQAAAERILVEQFWGNISPHWLEFVRTCRVGQAIDFEDFVFWVNDRAVAEGVQDPWSQLTP